MKYIVLVLAFYSQSLFSQAATDTINQLDPQGRKHGFWRGYYDDTKHLKYEGTFKNGRETGTFTFYDNTKTKKMVATRVFNPHDNSVVTTIYNGKYVVSTGKEVNKKREGEWKYFHKNSDQLMTLEKYKGGELNGMRKVFFANGQLAEESEYSNNKRHGTYRKFAPNGVVLEESAYSSGELHGNVIYRNGDNEVVIIGQFKNGRSTGVWKYYEKGELSREVDQDAVKKNKTSRTKR